MKCPKCGCTFANHWTVCGICKTRRYPEPDPNLVWNMVNGLVTGMKISDPRWKPAAKWLHENHPLR